ncbi:MAG: glycoside hydrolase family 9 protein, partial [Alphaproteobacteria bacterium]
MVPNGETYAGMAHHKVHDTSWTEAPMLPHLDPRPRALYAPSTAATLNLAAAAAQGARLFKPYDSAFSARLLKAAQKAWAAARKYPDLLAPSIYFDGGGNYGDSDVSDEFYWAATELYLTSGDKTYLSIVQKSPHWRDDVFTRGGHGAFDWASVAGLARLHLALYGKGILPGKDWNEVKASVIAAAQSLVAMQKMQPFGQMYHPENGRYDWGSNHLILQNMIVVSAAYDLDHRPEFLQSVRESMDYILGRNVMNISYVTGYGSLYSKNQHSRWFARQLDDSLPNPPPGSLAGGPNSSLVDEISRQKLKDCAPQQCYLDDINAYGSNEMTINWNAPLVYIANFLADTAAGGP